ncbi:uncharacterized protein LOC117640563 isoform X2 [Thrips palmi]|uniref:Uncharacterized protein LOC117640563 isoform X2 n=1 Tax=Thrips palmi TaxID=161013 RepID=A0A6P8YGC1_THRPL|nr:uncharacterized protein LOC117640563 isoform X2 [Thrips palmi]XP_034233007.1 uncharacterized protein LOC117640563 isoform X2 [Thrips palmi]XP_034233008.1 uncharacterized protein LOC117640563 isoform X2 [Thrips palmi]XP_034233009.1 uncharacterized protein LOC117640563 isoform X2 [Thrips palmi]XP_034233010.1 uncharacterized protein LOC117640563 isoform X2 [Thrips palmi]XP_034233011.1 uncharacterized protein LOC117640563 isoform X2 [Thrips palmi]XP_034233012.1 uncharacterized protein LOC11764
MPRIKEKRSSKASAKALSKAAARAASKARARGSPPLFPGDESDEEDEAADVIGELLELLLPDPKERQRRISNIMTEGGDMRLMINELVNKRRDDKAVMRLLQRMQEVGGCDCEARMAKFKSPFSWGWAAQPMPRCAYIADKLFQAGTDWNLAFDKLNLAYSLYTWSKRAEGRAKLVECYMLLLPGPSFNRGCPIVNDHREALRYLLDSTWASMCLVQRKQPCTGIDPVLAEFISTIKPYNTLPLEQKAAVLVMEGRFSDDEGLLRLARRAIALSPDEGEWKHMLGWKLQGQRVKQGGSVPGTEELAMLRDAVRLRRSPDTLTRLAISLADCGPAGRTEARQLVDQALAEYPDNAAVLSQAAHVVQLLGGSVQAVYNEVENLYTRALAVTGDCAHLRMKLGMVLQQRGKARQAKQQFQRAAAISLDAVEEFMKDVPFPFAK